MDDGAASGCLGMFLLFPAVGLLALGAIYGNADALLIGAVFAVVSLGVWILLGREREVLKGALQVAAAFLVMATIGMAIQSLNGSPTMDEGDCDSGPLATRC